MPRGRPSLSFIEAALLLCIISIVLAVFVPTFLRRVRTNKISEAAELLQDMSARTAAYYATSWNSGNQHCLPPSAGPTPAAPAIESADVDFFAEEQAGHATWEALGFQPEQPIRYSYSYTPSQSGCDLIGADELGSVSFRAVGDLDGDGVWATFERQATLEAGEFKPGDKLHVHQRTE